MNRAHKALDNYFCTKEVKRLYPSVRVGDEIAIQVPNFKIYGTVRQVMQDSKLLVSVEKTKLNKNISDIAEEYNALCAMEHLEKDGTYILHGKRKILSLNGTKDRILAMFTLLDNL